MPRMRTSPFGNSPKFAYTEFYEVGEESCNKYCYCKLTSLVNSGRNGRPTLRPTKGRRSLMGRTLFLPTSFKIVAALGAAFVLWGLVLAALCAPRAEADSIRVSCSIYAINEFDPIGLAHHQHSQFGNTSLTNESTGDSLYANKDTSCEDGGEWWTNAGWFPEEMNEFVPDAIIYYRGPEADDSQIVDIPRGMELIGKNDPNGLSAEVQYNCGASPGNTAPTQATPPYGCRQNFSTQVRFPRCWDGI